MSKPQVILQAGSPGQVGTNKISDMLFTSIRALPSLVMVEWNIAAESQASASAQLPFLKPFWSSVVLPR